MHFDPVRVASILVVLAATASAQTTTPEIEPNETKAQATANGAVTMVANDELVGTTTGSSTVVPGATSADTWRVRTVGLPAGIYRHTLTLTTSGTAGHTASLRGLNQTTGAGLPGVIGTVDSAFQTSIPSSPIPRSVAWYGFGRAEEIYYRVVGTTGTTAAYESTLTTATVAPIAVPNVFAPGSIVMTTVGQTVVDTDIHLFDGALNVIDDASNDDESIAEGGTSTALQSRLTRTLVAGTYYLAIGRFNTATNDNSPATDDFRTGLVLDFPDAIACSSTTNQVGGEDFDVVISDAFGPVAVSVTSPSSLPFPIVFVRFTVGDANPAGVPYCFGDGSGTACPCGNAGAAGNGCASSATSNGANLSAIGAASVGADTLRLHGAGMPNGTARYFQGTTQVAATFGDGLRCAGGTLIQLGTKQNAGGASQYPSVGDASVSVRGSCSAGDVRTYQCWYRDAASFCTPDTFNLTNGVSVQWGP